MKKPGRAALLGAACLFSLIPSLFAADSERVPASVVHARFVALVVETGDDMLGETAAQLDPHRVLHIGDLEALRALRRFVEAWDRYRITTHLDQADLLLAVRIGNRTTVSAGVTRGPSSAGTRSRTSYQASAEVSFLHDMLTVYDADNGRRGAVLWRSWEEDGLSEPSPKLFDELKKAVEKAAAKTP